MKVLPPIIRSARPEDIPFIYSSWLNSYKHGSSLGKLTRSSLFFDEYKHIIDLLLSNSRVHVICQPENENVIFGYMVSDRLHQEGRLVIHYCFIKEAFRNMGMATLLKDSFGGLGKEIYITHATKHTVNMLQSSKGNNMVYNPFLLYNKGMK